MGPGNIRGAVMGLSSGAAMIIAAWQLFSKQNHQQGIKY